MSVHNIDEAKIDKERSLEAPELPELTGEEEVMYKNDLDCALYEVVSEHLTPDDEASCELTEAFINRHNEFADMIRAVPVVGVFSPDEQMEQIKFFMSQVMKFIDGIDDDLQVSCLAFAMERLR